MFQLETEIGNSAQRPVALRWLRKLELSSLGWTKRKYEKTNVLASTKTAITQNRCCEQVCIKFHNALLDKLNKIIITFAEVLTINQSLVNDASENEELYESSVTENIPQPRGILKILADHGHMANIIAGFGFFINLTLAWFTYLLYEKTVEANSMSKDAINQSIDANSIGREANDEAKRANKINDTLLRFTRESNFSSDSLNHINMELTKKSISAQIEAMRQDKEQFLTLNKAFLSIDQIRIIDSIKTGKLLKISYRITNPGTYTAELLESSSIVYIGPKRRYELEIPVYSKNVSGFVTKEVWMTATSEMRLALTAFDVEILNNKENQIYFRFDGIYSDQLTGKKKRYFLVCRIDDIKAQNYIVLENKTENL